MTQGFDNLAYLDFSFNNLWIKLATDSFPNNIFLKLASFKLQKISPMMNQSNMYYLDISNNEIYGQITNWIWKNGSYFSLNCSGNKIVGFQETYSLINVGFLCLHHNHLKGKIHTLPPKWMEIDFSNIKFISILVDIGSLHFETYFFSISNNQLKWVILKSICYLTNL